MPLYVWFILGLILMTFEIFTPGFVVFWLEI
ncbi:MAG: NfeD family protein [Candidatus Hydrothermia bacterium]